MTKKVSNFTRKAVLISLASATCGFCTFSIAATKCNLGEPCPIPAKDGGATVVNVTPNTGMHYTCKVVSENQGKALKFALTEGKNFQITQGKSLYYNANPSMVINIAGRFDHPENPQSLGEIKFTKLPFSADGSVTCSVSS